MTHTTNLLDAYKATLNIPTDMAAAQALGLTRAAVSGWRTGNRHADADTVELMCRGLHEPLSKWLPLIESERARTPAIAKVWLRLAQATAGLAVIYLFSRLDVQMTGENLAFLPLAFIHYAKLPRGQHGHASPAVAGSGTAAF